MNLNLFNLSSNSFDLDFIKVALICTQGWILLAPVEFGSFAKMFARKHTLLWQPKIFNLKKNNNNAWSKICNGKLENSSIHR